MLAILLLASITTLTACRSSNIKETTKQTDHKTKKWKPLVITKREKAQAQKEVKQISDICQNIKINENKVLEFPQFYPQTSDFSPFIINNFMKMPKI